jgi:hypothetical protein
MTGKKKKKTTTSIYWKHNHANPPRLTHAPYHLTCSCATGYQDLSCGQGSACT